MNRLDAHLARADALQSREIVGSVSAVRGLSVLVRDLPVPIGALVRVELPGGSVRGEVVGFNGHHAIVMLFDASDGIAPRQPVRGEQVAPTVQVGPGLLGRVIDGLGRPIDGRDLPTDLEPQPIHADPIPALDRARIVEPMPTGVRAIDALLTLGRGQRIGVFSGPGVGKSTLLASMARGSAADVTVIALIGERGREVKDFIELALGPDGLARSVIVVATGDQSPLLRVRAASVACAVAESFRDTGANVVLMMDSITRLAQAQRQIGLAAGEQPATKGYTPSVFAILPAVLERAGALASGGSVTGIYAVLVEGDDLNEPISDAARGVLDGHIALSRRLAAHGHFPAIDVLESISRVADEVSDEAHVEARRTIRRLVAVYRESEELINIGAYARGSNPICDIAIELKPKLDAFLCQDRDEEADYPRTCRQLIELSLEAGRFQAALAGRVGHQRADGR